MPISSTGFERQEKWSSQSLTVLCQGCTLSSVQGRVFDSHQMLSCISVITSDRLVTKCKLSTVLIGQHSFVDPQDCRAFQQPSFVDPQDCRAFQQPSFVDPQDCPAFQQHKLSLQKRAAGGVSSRGLSLVKSLLALQCSQTPGGHTQVRNKR